MTREADERSSEQSGDGTSRRRFLGATTAVATVAAVGSLGAAKRRDGKASRQTGDGKASRQTGGATAAKRAFRFGGREQGWYGRAPQVVAGLANPTLRLEPGAVYEVTWENLDGLPHNFAFLDADGEFLPVILPEDADLEATQIANATGANAAGDNATDENATGGNATTATETTEEATATAETTGTGTTQTTQDGATQFPENGIEQTEIIRQQGDDQTFYFVAVPQIAEYLCVVHPERMDGEVVVGEGAAQTTTESS